MELPLAYRWLRANGFERLVPWYLIDDEEISKALGAEYRKESGRDSCPFARRQDNDDIAGFEMRGGEILERVISVHLTWSGRREQPGFPVESAPPQDDVFAWLVNVVIPDTLAWMSEREVAELSADPQR